MSAFEDYCDAVERVSGDPDGNWSPSEIGPLVRAAVGGVRVGVENPMLKHTITYPLIINVTPKTLEGIHAHRHD